MKNNYPKILNYYVFALFILTISFQNLAVTQLGLDQPLDVSILVSDSANDCVIFGDIPGSCTVKGRKVSSINCLSKTKVIEGDLDLRNTLLTDLNDLANLQIIGGNFHVQFNSRLKNVDGLSAIKEIGGNLVIHGNHQLEDCCILKSLVSMFSFKVKGDIFIANNKTRGMCSDQLRIASCK